MRNIKPINVFCFSVLFFSLSFSQNGSLNISVTNAKGNKGRIYVAIYNDETNFLKKHFTGNSSVITNDVAFFSFTVPKGTYAISAFHDENSNGILDKNVLGIPKERYGFSNNAKGFMSAPSFEQAKVSVTGNKNIEIKLH